MASPGKIELPIEVDWKQASEGLAMLGAKFSEWGANMTALSKILADAGVDKGPATR